MEGEQWGIGMGIVVVVDDSRGSMGLVVGSMVAVVDLVGGMAGVVSLVGCNTVVVRLGR